MFECNCRHKLRGLIPDLMNKHDEKSSLALHENANYERHIIVSETPIHIHKSTHWQEIRRHNFHPVFSSLTPPPLSLSRSLSTSLSLSSFCLNLIRCTSYSNIIILLAAPEVNSSVVCKRHEFTVTQPIFSNFLLSCHVCLLNEIWMNHSHCQPPL